MGLRRWSEKERERERQQERDNKRERQQERERGRERGREREMKKVCYLSPGLLRPARMLFIVTGILRIQLRDAEFLRI